MFVLLAGHWGLKRSNESNLKELLFDRAQKVKAGLDFSFRIVCLHRGGYHCHKPTLGGHLISGGHHGDIDVGLPPNLLLWNDDLS